MNLYNRKAKSTTTAFTLAEVLTTLMVIGIVAILTIPNMVKHIQETTLAKQRTIFMKKFEEGLKQMRVDDKLNTTYPSTSAFVDEMKKYFKITQVCYTGQLDQCFTERFTFNEIINLKYNTNNNSASYTEEPRTIIFNTAELSTNVSFYTKLRKSASSRSSFVSIIFADGTKMMIAYKRNCQGPASGETRGNHFTCFEYIADVNGAKGPNLIPNDILTNMNISDTNFEIAPVGVISSDTFGCGSGSKNNNISCDYWLGAKNYCENLTIDGGGWKLPTEKQLDYIATLIYTNAECGSVHSNGTSVTYFGPKSSLDDEPCNSSKVFGHPLWQNIFPQFDQEVWEDGDNDNQNYKNSRIFWGIGSNRNTLTRDNATISAICVR